MRRSPSCRPISPRLNRISTRPTRKTPRSRGNSRPRRTLCRLLYRRSRPRLIRSRQRSFSKRSMSAVEIERRIRWYQQPLHQYLVNRPSPRAIEIARRRWGEDEVVLAAECELAHKRIGTYWHLPAGIRASPESALDRRPCAYHCAEIDRHGSRNRGKQDGAGTDSPLGEPRPVRPMVCARSAAYELRRP